MTDQPHYLPVDPSDLDDSNIVSWYHFCLSGGTLRTPAMQAVDEMDAWCQAELSAMPVAEFSQPSLRFASDADATLFKLRWL